MILMIKIVENCKTLKYCVFIFIFLAIAAGINGCRPQRKATATDAAAVTFYNQCFPIESFFAPSCRLELSMGGQTFSLNGSIYIRPDSVFYFRGRMMLFDVVRGAIYKDSFVVVNYIERVYYTGKNEFLQKTTGFPVNPESLMMLFTADRCEETYRNKLNFVITAGSRADRILMYDPNRNALEITINSDVQTIENITLSNNRQRQPLFSAIYSNYDQFEKFKLPASLNITAHDGVNPIRIIANFQQIQLNQPQQINISIPSNYQMIVLE